MDHLPVRAAPVTGGSWIRGSSPRWGETLLLVLTLLLCREPLSAQSAEVSGRVTAAGTGEAVAAVEVTLEGETRRVLRTDSEGRWSSGSIVAGEYTLTFRHPGYAPAARSVEVPLGGAMVEAALTPRPILLGEVVVTAGRRSMLLGEAPVPVEIVGRAEIEETGAPDLAGVLSERIGLELQGGHPTGSGIMIQGMGPERVLILMDGEPFIGRISGQVDLSRIPTSMIERIEVVKGPQSTLYGSEAMGGVVNVITRRPDSHGSGELRATAGAQGRLDLGVRGTGSVGNLRGIGNLGRRTLDEVSGISSAAGTLSERWDGQGSLDWSSPAHGVRIEIGGILLDESQRWASGQLYNFADNLQWSGRILLEAERGADRFVATGYFTAFDHLARRSTAPRPLAGSGDKETQRLQSVDLLYGRHFGAHSLDLGIEAEREAIRSDRVVDAERDTRTVEVFGQATLSLRRITLVPGVRATRSELWGNHLTPRVAALYRPTANWLLRLSAGEGFRAPEFKETHIEFLNVGTGFAYTVRGNPDLRPEQSRNLTASVEWAGDRAYMRVQGYHNNFDGFIETIAAGDSSGVVIYTYGNLDDGFTRGAEVEAGVVHQGWRFEIGHSWLRAEHRMTGESILGRPLSSSRALLTYAHPTGTRLSLTGIRTGRTAMSRNENETMWRDPFVRFDLRFSQSLPGGVEVGIGADNVFGAVEEEWPGFTERHIYTALSWRPFGGN